MLVLYGIYIFSDSPRRRNVNSFTHSKTNIQEAPHLNILGICSTKRPDVHLHVHCASLVLFFGQVILEPCPHHTCEVCFSITQYTIRSTRAIRASLADGSPILFDASSSFLIPINSVISRSSLFTSSSVASFCRASL